MRKLLLVVVCLLLAGVVLPLGFGEELSPSEIIKKVDYNQSPDSVIYSVKMVIHQNNREDIKEFKLYGEGVSKSYVWFQSPKRDFGTSILRLSDNLWIYYPSANKSLKLSGNMLRQSFMGSDFSLEDSTDRFKLLENYEPSLLESETVDNKAMFVVELKAKNPNAIYFRRKLWVDAEKLVMTRQEMYAKSGKLLKVKIAEEIQLIKDRYFETKVRMEDKLKQNSYTEMFFYNITLDEPIPAGTFTMKNLERKH